ncbi:MAG: T9SS type A sorting domain-containing protein [Ignavibacteria bacterium]|nr:T9SS type A sorting domain-containing protein [Ignavibacteria bacterium]
MRKIILILLLFCSASIYAAGWVRMPSITGIADNIIYKVLPDGQGNLFASIRAGGIYKSTNGGASWALSGAAGGSVYNLILAPNGDIYGIGRAGSSETIYRSTNSGASWQTVYSKSFSQNASLWGEIVFPSNGQIIAAFSVTVYPTVSDVDTYVIKSSNGGNDWSDLGFIGPLISMNTGGGSGMVIGADGNIYLGTGQAGLLSSSNFGAGWAGVTSVSSMFTSFLQKGNVGNSIFEGEAYGVNRSTNNCGSFSFLGPFNAWSYTKKAGIGPNDEIYIALSDGRVFISNDLGTSWTENHTGISYGFQTDAIAFNNGKVYLAGHKPGLYDGELYTIDLVTGVGENSNVVNGYQLKQNYPNPFNPSTKISFSIPKQGYVKLSVFDALGKEVSRLVNEVRVSGNYEITFDASFLSGGVYYYRLETERFNETRKMILIK